MLALSKTGPIDDLIAAVQALPDSTDTVPAEFAAPVKELARARLNAIRSDPNHPCTHAHLNLRVNVLDVLHSHQMDLSVTGRAAPK